MKFPNIPDLISIHKLSDKRNAQTHISSLNSKFNVVAQIQGIDVALEFAIVEKYLLYDIRSFDESEILFQGTHNALIDIRHSVGHLPNLSRP